MSRRRALEDAGWLIRDGGPVEFVDAPARRSVVWSKPRFHPRVRSHIEKALFADTTELGGWLWGEVGPGGFISISHATTATVKRSKNRVQLDPRDSGPTLDPLTRLGCWHSHPSGGTRPSEQDRTVWDARYGHLRARSAAVGWVSLVVGARGGSRRFTAYITDTAGTREISF